MKIINSILEALLNPKQHDRSSGGYGNGGQLNGLILIPVPSKPQGDGRPANNFTSR